MVIKIIKPYGICKGVKRSIDIVYKAKKQNENKNIKVLGMLIHNEHILNDLEKLNIETVEDIKAINNDDICVLRAHGSSKITYKYLSQNNIKFYDSTCPIVQSINNYVSKNSGKTIIYIGIKNHDESKVTLSLSKNIYLFDLNNTKNFNFKNINSKNPIIINQSTINKNDIDYSLKILKKHFPQLINKTKICPSINDRFEKLKKYYSKENFYIIVGSKFSNNAKSLFNLTNKKNKNSVLTNNIDEIKKIDLSKYKSVYIVSATSALNNEVDEIIAYLKSLI